MQRTILFILITFFGLAGCQPEKRDLSQHPQIKFASEQILKAQSKGIGNDPLQIELNVDSTILGKQEYQIQANGKKIIVTGGDINGLMYGGFEVAEQLELNGKVEDTEARPYIKKRGIKFNIPLDARTPGYDDTGDAAQKNYAEMWEWSFWEEYLDDLAIHRYNTLTLWNPHPFPSMVKLPNFPDVALEDVCVTTLVPTGKESEWAEPQMVSSNVVENLKVVKKMTIDEKIAFWQKVMQHAADRGIDIYLFTWNLCANGAATPVPPHYRSYNQPLWKEVPGKHGITNQMDNPINVDYYRESVKTFLLIYPNVKGIGVTAGEHMLDEAGGYTREQWIWETYGQGMLDVQKEQPDRKIDFIHRVWNTDMDKIMHYWKDYPGSFEASFKYAKARLYSNPYLNFADKHIEDMKKFGLKSWWNLRNDDIFVHRWGDPDYVRSFIGHFQKEHTAGFYMGSDGYVWGKEFTNKNPELSGQLEIKKHWYNFMLWGRLAYDNELDRSFFVIKLKSHFPKTDAELLYSGWQTASKIIPQVNMIHWQDWDYQWSVEGCIDQRNGFHDVIRFMDNRIMPGKELLNPADFAKATLLGKEISKTTPLQVSDKLEKYAVEAIQISEKLNSEDNAAELNNLLDDMKSMAYLGQYYAAKIKGATELAFFRENKKVMHKEKALMHLVEAVQFWEQYRQISEKNNHPQRLARTRMLDLTEIMEDVKEDVELAKNYNPK
ncbi:MAG: hypothetical protein JXQ96_11090 [Cyclobacteriaceae bacterium]